MAPKRKRTVAQKDDDELSDKQAYVRERTKFHIASGLGQAATAKLCERDWRRLGTPAAKRAAAAQSRARLLPIPDPPVVDDPTVGPGGVGPMPGADPTPGLVNNFDDALAKDQRRLAAAANLANLEGRHWKGQHYLGGGTYGHAHLYLELDANDKILQRMVVKDCWPGINWGEVFFWWGDLRDPIARRPVEIKCMELLKSLPGSEVVVQLRDFIVYPAKRSMRIFMSYAGHGCLEGIRDLYPAASIRLVLGPIGRAGGAARQHKYVPEAAVWSLLEQLNRARILMEYGSTDDDNRPENWDQIVHRDFKPENIFLDAPATGSPYPCAVLGDFGLSIITRDDDELNPLFYGDETATTGYTPPEQVMRFNSRTFDPVPLAKVLAWTNIWAMGAVLARAMRGKRITRDNRFDPVEDSPTYSNGPEDYQWFDTGTENAYTPALRDLILACLQYVPVSRPTNIQIRNRIQNHLASNPITMDSDPLEFPKDLYKEGMAFVGRIVGTAG